MSEADKLWDETGDIFSSWNLQEIPFSESASSLRSNLDKVFTGRTTEPVSYTHLTLPTSYAV